MGKMQPYLNTIVKTRFALVLIFVFCGACVFAAAPPAERRAFNTAMQSFRGGWWEIADRQFGEFINKYPQSELLPEALLRQAQARFRLRKFSDAVELLSTQRDKAAQLADEWYFWLGEAQFASSNYTGAADAYGIVVRNFPDSMRAPSAAYYEALAYARLGKWSRAVELLVSPAGPLQRTVAANPTNDLAVNSRLLLAEAHIALGNLSEAETNLVQLGVLDLGACTEWRRLYLLGRLYVRAARMEDALTAATRLSTRAEDCGRDELRAESVLFKATVLEHAGRLDDALAEYGKLLDARMPTSVRRTALLKSVGLNLRQGRLESAAALLQNHIAQNPQDNGSDAAQIALGELRLKQFAEAVGKTNVKRELPVPSEITNLLEQALAQFDSVISNAPSGPFTGRAFLGKGWCLWLLGKVAESKAAFESAVEQLPFSEDQAVARFKLADAQFVQGDFAAALSNYQAVAAEYGGIQPARDTLVEPALYQAARAALAMNDLAAATNAMRLIVRDFPGGFRAQSVLLLAGQDIAARGSPGLAREFFAEFERRYPDSPLLTEVKLALARTFEQEKNWVAAARVYDEWVTNNAQSELLPQVEYRRGLANYHAGFETNAFAIFTNIIFRFPTNPVAPLAQNWIADFYFRQGDFKRAEENYQLLYQHWPESELAYEARMMAGRAAVASLRFADAVTYFTYLINDPGCPSNLVAQALFAYGDALTRQDSADTNRPLANYEEAIRVFSKLQRLYPATEFATLAWGRIGDCYLQLAGQDPTYFTNALAAYQTVVDDPRAGVAARSQAEVGLGIVLDKQAQLLPEPEQHAMRQRALEHYLRVVYQQNLREGEQADPFWVKEAGLRAMRLAEELQMWEQLATDGGLCDYLGKVFPQLSQAMEARKLRAKMRLDSPGT